MPIAIAIDGPASSGKSTVGMRLAEQLDFLFLDTGLLYRAVTAAAQHTGQPVDDADGLAEFTRALTLEIRAAPDHSATLLVNGQDVTPLLRTPTVEAEVSIVSANPVVREVLTAHMRRFGQRGSIVMVGRDIGTVVLPDATLKVYLDASPEERARRRYAERAALGDTRRSYDDILANLRERDTIDSSRATAPLQAAPDALILDTTGLAIDEVVQRIITALQAVTA